MLVDRYRLHGVPEAGQVALDFQRGDFRYGGNPGRSLEPPQVGRIDVEGLLRTVAHPSRQQEGLNRLIEGDVCFSATRRPGSIGGNA